MNREKLAWTVSILLISFLAFQIPGTLAQRDDDYSFVRTLVDIHRQVSNNYVEPVDEDRLRQGAIDGMLGELDPFSVYVPPARQEEFDRMLEGSFKGVGIQLNQTPEGKVEVVTPIDGSPAFKAGIQAGDIITKVNGESIDNLRLEEVIKKIGGPLGSQVTLSVRHATGDDATLTMTREEIVVPTVKGYGRNADNTWDWWVAENPKIGYIRITQFTPDTYEKTREVIESLLKDGMKGLLLDLRFNPGGRLDEAVQIVDMFVKSGTIVSTKGRNRPERVEYATGKDTLPEFPLIVLVNEHSASASEIVAGSLLDNHRALVIGQRTYGKGSVQEVIPLDGKSGELKLTVAYYYLPSGRLVHRKKDATDWGVEPQIVVPMDAAAEQRVLRDRYEQELFHKPTTRTAAGAPTTATTRPTTVAAVAATQPLDPQLQQAITTMVGLVVLQGNTQVAAATPRDEKPLKQSVTTLPNNDDHEAPVPTKPNAATPTTKPAATSLPASVTIPDDTAPDSTAPQLPKNPSSKPSR